MQAHLPFDDRNIRPSVIAFRSSIKNLEHILAFHNVQVTIRQGATRSIANITAVHARPQFVDYNTLSTIKTVLRSYYLDMESLRKDFSVHSYKIVFLQEGKRKRLEFADFVVE